MLYKCVNIYIVNDSLNNDTAIYTDYFGAGVLKGCEHKQRSSKVPCHGSPPRWLPGFVSVFETHLRFPQKLSLTIRKIIYSLVEW